MYDYLLPTRHWLFPRINRPQINCKAQRVIPTLTVMWHQQEFLRARKSRQISLPGFSNFYNSVKPHKIIDNMALYEKMIKYYDHFE